MEFLVAKCPNCGGDLRLPDDKKHVKCMYCGFDIIVRDAVDAAGANVKNWLKLASTAKETGNHAEAYKYFTQILEFEPENYVALIGKGIAAGYLSTSDRLRSEELIKGIKAAFEHVPKDKEIEFKLQIADEIYSVCLFFERVARANRLEGELGVIRLISQTHEVANCLELAHNYAPKNGSIITLLYFKYRIIAGFNKRPNPIGKSLDKSNDSTLFDKEVEKYHLKAEDCLSKLQIFDPEKAESLREISRKTDDKLQGGQKTKVQTTVGNGCLVIILVLISVPLFFALLIY